MHLSFLMDNIGAPHKLNDQQSIQYMQLKQRKDLLTRQLYDLMVNDGDI